MKLEYREGAFFLRYYQSLLPIDPRTYRTILTHGLDALKAAQPPDSEDLRELESIVTALEHLPERTETEPQRVAERQREKEVIKGRLRALTDRAAAVAEFIAGNVQELNGTPADPHSYDGLDKLLDAQVYRLSHWKAAADEINYRRFFDINELAAVCMEAPEVFAESHRLVFELLVRGDVSGLRVDHIDGLYDPPEYLRRLQRGYLLALGKVLYQRATEAGTGAGVGMPSGLEAREACSEARCVARRVGGEPAALERHRTGVPAAGHGNDLRRPAPPCRSTWSWKKSSPPRKPCPKTGCWPAPRATIS